MNKFFNTKVTRSAMILATIITITSTSFVRAQGTTVPINTSFNYHSIMSNQKDFTLDKIATMVAKVILHAMTADVVDWINSGFQGNPAFLSNPQGFFLDSADQITGKFIAENGELSALCGPFGIDIRASLGLGMSGGNRRRAYACTLGSIIDQAKNTKTGDLVTVNGASMEGFVNGDFSQGGWKAFAALTTEPQNNPTGAYLMAKSDLLSQITGKEDMINQDLNRGGGFMSWQNCETAYTARPDTDPAEVESYDIELENSGGTMQAKTQPNGDVLYQKCETQTPGNLISGAANKQLGAGTDELIAADDINKVVSALVTQLAKTALEGGFKSAGGTTKNIRNQSKSDNANTLKNSKNVKADYTTELNNIKNIKYYYDQSVELVNNSKLRFLEVKQCFSTLPTPNSTKVSDINKIITNKIDPLLSSLLIKQTKVNDILKGISATASLENKETTNIDEIVAASQSSTAQYLETIKINDSDVTTAITDYKNAQLSASNFDNQSNTLQSQCI